MAINASVASVRIRAKWPGPLSDYDYVEIPRRAPPSESERLRSYDETLALLRAGAVQSLGLKASGARKSYEALTRRSPNAMARERDRVLWLTLRAENESRHQAATRSAPARMVANMLDNWPAWYPQHLKPSAKVAEEDAKQRVKKPRKSRPC